MATISNTPRPGYVWDSTDNVWYPIGVGAHQHTNAADTPAVIPNALVDAKGDLLTATADNTPARLAVGSNGETIVADSSTSTGLRYQGSMAAGRNGVINGGMDIWQRGTSFTSTNGDQKFAADRWQLYSGSTGRTFSRQTTSDTTNLPFIQYCMRVARDSGNTNTSVLTFGSNFETVNSLPYAGKTVTLSFYARAGANYSATSNALAVSLYTGTGTDQDSVYDGYTGPATPINTTVTLTTTWQRFSATGTVAATATEVCPYFAFTPTGTAGANDYLEITGVQLEIGSVATQFSRAGGSIQGELAACQRYFVAYGGNQTFEAIPGWGSSRSTTTSYMTIPYPQMRSTPSFAVSAAGDWVVIVSGVTSQEATNLSLSTTESGNCAALITATTAVNASLGGDKPIRMSADNTTAARMFFSAEL